VTGPAAMASGHGQAGAVAAAWAGGFRMEGAKTMG
jgi:hypothetical protein